ncbi:MAG: T9SS type A sorting domain-containing protein [Paludibacter sp.]|nr:T9SS type A sorting domain-containing protein [Paludibacter sp.]
MQAKSLVDPTPVVTTLWENGASAGTLPAWFLTTTNKTRGIGASNEFVFVATREGTDGKSIYVYNAVNGEYVAAMNTADLSLGTFVLNDVGVTDDGKIIAANLGANTNFKIYMYNDRTSSPTVLLHLAAPEGGRTGDLITVTGDYSKGTAKIYTASATHPSQIWVLEMADGVWKTERRFIATMSGVTAAVAACVAPKPDGSMYWKAGGQSFKLIKSDASIDELGAGFSLYSNAIKFIGHSTIYNLDYVALFTYGGGKECAEIVALTPGDLSTCKLITRTPSIGTNANAGGTGDVAIRYDADNNPIVYVVSTNNGFGAYKIAGLGIDVLTGFNSISNDLNISIFPNPTKGVVNISEMAKSVKLFSVSGQLLKEEYMINKLNVDGLQGVYFMQIESENGKITKRLIVN